MPRPTVPEGPALGRGECHFVPRGTALKEGETYRAPLRGRSTVDIEIRETLFDDEREDELPGDVRAQRDERYTLGLV